jgi:cobalt-zinc-cadmium efflux system membrane fusion protein
MTIFWVLQACAAREPEATATPEAPEKNSISLTAAQVEKAQIRTESLEQKTIHQEIAVNGVVDVPPQNMVSVSFPMGGYLRSTKLLPGMYVRKGEVIGLMEEQSLVQLQQDYLVTQARLAYLEKEYERQRELNEGKVNADKTLQQAQADYQSHKVMLKGFAEKLRLIGMNPENLKEATISRQVPLYAPTSGYVSKVNVNVGKYVQPIDVLFELINPDDIHAALTIFEKDLGKVRIGQRVKIFFVDEPEKEYSGEVILVNKNVDENRAAIAHCHFLTKPGQLLPGMFLNARIEASQASGPAVPEAAVLRYQNKTYVFVETAPNTYLMQEITIGERDAGYVSVLEGSLQLKGKKIVVANAYTLLGSLKNVSEE